MSERPLSPHLQIYHPSMTMIMSIAHRLSGLGLYVCMVGFVLWLAALAFAPDLFNQAQILARSPVGQVVIFVICWAFTHHLFGGLRHFLWDTGRGLGPRAREWLAWGTFILGLGSAAVIVWWPSYQDMIGMWL